MFMMNIAKEGIIRVTKVSKLFAIEITFLNFAKGVHIEIPFSPFSIPEVQAANE